MTPNELTKAICDYGLKPYITFEIVRNHYECHLKPEYQNQIDWKYNNNVDRILTIAFTCRTQTVKRRLLHLKRMIDQELLKRYRILDRNANRALTQSESQENTILTVFETIDKLAKSQNGWRMLYFQQQLLALSVAPVLQTLDFTHDDLFFIKNLKPHDLSEPSFDHIYKLLDERPIDTLTLDQNKINETLNKFSAIYVNLEDHN
jgi:hypothetical protein